MLLWKPPRLWGVGQHIPQGFSLPTCVWETQDCEALSARKVKIKSEALEVVK